MEKSNIIERSNPAFRHELKYIISEEERDILIARIKDILPYDSHAADGGYLIRSLYFDDYWKTAYEEKMAGTALRKKYRIRIYDNKDDVIKLECKNKQGNYIYKEAVSLTREETDRILEGDVRFLRERKEPLCKEFYVAYISEVLRPQVLVDYDRKPFIFQAGTVRITFDMHVRAGVGSTGLFDKTVPVVETLNPGELILEVKYTECLPQLIRQLVPPGYGRHSAASKYCMCYEKKQMLLG